ncbi:hypothetical protein O3G_MSEX015347, partial [Manduca sexta]
RPRVIEKSAGERYPPTHEMRCMLNTLVDEAVVEARKRREDRNYLTKELEDVLQEGTEKVVEAMGLVEILIDRATGVTSVPVKQSRYHHYMKRIVGDALARSEPFSPGPCPKELPSERRRLQEELVRDKTCRCDEPPPPQFRVMFEGEAEVVKEESAALLPSELRALEELRRCKCDTSAAPSPADVVSFEDKLDEDQTEAEDTIRDDTPDD